MRISIITVSYNSAATIRDTLQSISKQEYSNVEHIVVDGKSTDDTVKIIREFKHIAKFISEPDNGLYDAMNKGLQLASGNIIGILNSDDIYTDNTILSKVAVAFNDPAIYCAYGDLQYVHQKNLKKVKKYK